MTDLKTIAKGVFDRFPKEDKVFVTSDGQAFFDEVHAKNHAIKNHTGKELKLETFLREDKSNGDAPKTAAELILLINSATEIETVQEILNAENAGSKRKSVIDAVEKKITELSKTE